MRPALGGAADEVFGLHESRVEDLLEVKGIGESSLAKLKPYLAVEGKSTLSAD